MHSEKKIIEKCLKNDTKAQESFYRLFAPTMYGVCLRFAKNRMEAEDILQEGFIKVFSFLKNYRSDGSLEGWIRKIMINTAINYYRKNVRFAKEANIDEYEVKQNINENVIDRLAANELLKIINTLPDNYRLIFNLGAIEGFTHKEIGEMLDIPENTSKSQLLRTRSILQQKIKEFENK
ncbi:MAG: RNA polymerase sigma factor [Bacteroidales bacterium]|nr:RNA polymerase sigma factor [Bacteroidales bacterium]